jgi:hypothetical protein
MRGEHDKMRLLAKLENGATAKEYLAERRPLVEGLLSKIVAKAVAMAFGVFERLPPTQVRLKIRLQSVYMTVCGVRRFCAIPV